MLQGAAPVGRAVAVQRVRAPAASRISARAAFADASFRRFIRGKACNLAQGREELREDLEQTAWLAVFSISGEKTLAYFRTVAAWRIRDLLRGEARFKHCQRSLHQMAAQWLRGIERPTSAARQRTLKEN